MSQASTQQRITDVLIDLLDSSEDLLVPTTNLRHDLDMDDLDLARLEVALNHEFGLNFTREDRVYWFTVQQVIDQVQDQIDARG